MYRLLTDLLVRNWQRQSVPVEPTRAQKIDWAWGSAVIENPAVTRKMVEDAVDARRDEAA